MTTTPIERFTQITQGDVCWEFAKLDIPGECDRYEWCSGPCEPLNPGLLGDYHGRYIASALRERGDLMEISVSQWKADPNQPWTLSASAGAYVNRDHKPSVILAVYPPDLDQTKRVDLKPDDAEAFALGLRMVGHDQFADALVAAATFARNLKEKS